MAFTHTNAKGQTYTLHGKQATLRNGHQQPIYYFAREARPHEALDAVPDGYRIGENDRTGLPYLYRTQQGQ